MSGVRWKKVSTWSPGTTVYAIVALLAITVVATEEKWKVDSILVGADSSQV